MKEHAIDALSSSLIRLLSLQKSEATIFVKIMNSVVKVGLLTPYKNNCSSPLTIEINLKIDIALLSDSLDFDTNICNVCTAHVERNSFSNNRYLVHTYRSD